MFHRCRYRRTRCRRTRLGAALRRRRFPASWRGAALRHRRFSAPWHPLCRRAANHLSQRPSNASLGKSDAVAVERRRDSRSRYTVCAGGCDLVPKFGEHGGDAGRWSWRLIRQLRKPADDTFAVRQRPLNACSSTSRVVARRGLVALICSHVRIMAAFWMRVKMRCNACYH